MQRLPPLPTLQPEAQKAWRRTDPILHALSKATPLPADAVLPGDDPFEALVASITHQQVSLAAGRSIHASLTRLLGGKVTPRRILNRSPEELRAAGLSRSKAAYIHDLAAKTRSGEVAFGRFPAMADAAIVGELTQVKGIGDWTAKMFLIFHLQRPDVAAPEDLGLRLAASHFYGVPESKAWAYLEAKAEAWSPYTSVANLVLWRARRHA